MYTSESKQQIPIQSWQHRVCFLSKITEKTFKILKLYAGLLE